MMSLEDDAAIFSKTNGLEKIAIENKLRANNYLVGPKSKDESSTNSSEVVPFTDITYFDDGNEDVNNSDEHREVNPIQQNVIRQDSEYTKVSASHDIVSTLKSMMNEEIYENGVGAPSEIYFKSLVKKNQLRALNSLLCLFMDSYSINNSNKNIHYLVGCLHLISHLDYSEVYPTGQAMAISALSYSGSREVQEYGIKCFEDWGNIDGVDKLSAVDFSAKWLQDYANEVIEEIIKENNGILRQENFQSKMA